MDRCYLGIDPGKQGAIAAITLSGVVFCNWANSTTAELCDFIRDLQHEHECVAVIEKVGTRPGEGNVGAFTFGANAGWWEGAVTMAEIRFTKVAPQTWKKEFGLNIKGKSTPTQRKNLSRQRAHELWPELSGSITNHNAEALLIAEYCRRKS